MRTNDLNESLPSELTIEKNSKLLIDNPHFVGGTDSNKLCNTKQFNQLAFLHPLRFILAFSIILWHCAFSVADNYETHPVLWAIRAITIFGGNQAFWLISGMLFYLSSYPKLTNDEMKVTTFLKKRAVRIYPTVIASVLISYILSLIIHFSYNIEENINLIDLIKDMLFFGARLFGGDYGIYNGPIWFLAPLFVSYLVSSLIIVVTRKKKSIYWFCIPLFISFFAELGSTFIVPVFNVQAVAAGCFNFFLGFFFMVFLTNFNKWPSKIKIPLRIVCLVVTGMFLYAFYKTKADSPLGNGEIIGSIFCWIPLITCLYGLKINKVFDNLVLRIMGALSFHMFVWHVVVYKMWYVCFSLQQKTLPSNLSSLFIFICSVLVISAISYGIDVVMRKYKVINKLKTKLGS